MVSLRAIMYLIIITYIIFSDPDEEEAVFQSEDWTYIIDCGGLIHVSDTTYMLFVAMEVEIRKNMSQLNLLTNFKEMAITNILGS